MSPPFGSDNAAVGEEHYRIREQNRISEILCPETYATFSWCRSLQNALANTRETYA